MIEPSIMMLVFIPPKYLGTNKIDSAAFQMWILKMLA
jgi:hypothetical protein